MKYLIASISCALALSTAGCGEQRSAVVGAERAETPELYYHIFVRSFTDSDGDQHGDLQGIIDSLDYLQSLGVTGLVLTPLYPSAFYHNYFADEFYGIDPEFGDMATYLALLAALDERGMTIILDQEIQYVSGQHEWYTDAGGNPGSPVDGFVLFADEDNTQPIGTLWNRTSFDVWPNQQQTIVTVDMLNRKVRDYFETYLLFWIDPNGDGDFSDGVDGFRIDHMMDDLDNAGVLTGLFDAFWVPIFDELRAVKPDIVLVAEQADWGYGAQFLEHGETDMVFGFPVWNAATKLDATAFAKAVTWTNEVISDQKGQFVFIENHDTDRFAGENRNQIDILKLGAAINILTGWTPIIYYGQEIGMTGNKALDSEAAITLLGSIDDAKDIPVRQAFRWHADHHDGTLATWYRADPAAYPFEDSNQPGDGVSVRDQNLDPNSLLNTYRDLSALRRSHPALADGTVSVLLHHQHLVILRRQKDDEVALVAFNFADETAEVSWPQSAPLDPIFGDEKLTRLDGVVTAKLAPFAVAVWSER